ncbi:MAG TPA: hypothetical protein VGI93_17810 [Steroidobacteraceae bacterium]|jgi:DNA-directed RNA polymerase specialized sigma24 family protein
MDQAGTRKLIERNINRLAQVAARVTRRLPNHAKEEIYAAALLSAIEKNNFDPESRPGTPEASLSGWFAGVCKDARKAYFSREKRHHLMQQEITPTIDINTPESIVTADDLRRFASGLFISPKKCEVVRQIFDGASEREAAEVAGVRRSDVRKIKSQLRRQIEPGMVEYRVSHQRTQTSSSDNMGSGPESAIDYALTRVNNLTFPPDTAHKDCPPCLLCSWFDGMSMGAPRHSVSDPEVAKAIADTHQRKVEISVMVRAGDGWKSPAPHKSTKDTQ